MEANLLRTLVVTIPLFSAVITQTTGTLVSLEISELLVQWFVIQQGFVHWTDVQTVLA